MNEEIVPLYEGIQSSIVFSTNQKNVLELKDGEIFILGEKVEDREKIYDALVSWVCDCTGDYAHLGPGCRLGVVKDE